MSNHNYDTTFTHDLVRSGSQQEPIKTGSILINRQDTLPQYQDQIHTDPRTHETYANLKPWSQIQNEQGGIVHSIGSSSSYDTMSMSTPNVRFDERPITNAQPSRVYSRQFNLEFARQKPEEDVMKTGGIVINPSDVHTSQRMNVQRDDKRGVSYAMLKPWTQIQEEQFGMVHSMPINKGPTRVDDLDKSRQKRTSYKEEAQDQMVSREPLDRSQHEILHRAKTEISRTQQRDAHFGPSRPADILHVPGAHTTRVIRPEDMLPWMRDYSKEGQVPYPLNRILVDRQMTMNEEPSGTETSKEDVMPLRRPKTENEDVQAMSRSITALRQKNSGSSYCELNRAKVEVEPIKTGGILVDPRDVHTSQRSTVQPLPNSNLSFAQLKPWNQIQGTQSGIIHSNTVQLKPPHLTFSKEFRKNNKSITTAPIGQRESQVEFSRSGNAEPIKGGRGTMLVNPEDMRNPRETGLDDITNFDRLNPQTKDLLNSHARSQSMKSSNRDVAKPNEYALKTIDMTESVMVPTQNTLNELGSKLDTLLDRSRTAIYEASLTSLDENAGTEAGNYQSETGHKGTSLGAF